nr:putative ribonuclease H-like domain-containing protein [Tanacetum cinerariifolium]
MSYLSDFKELNGRYVAFGGNPKGGNNSGKGKIRTGKLDFDDVYFFKELMFNIFSILQMYDKQNNVLFTDTKCLVLSPEFKLPNENQVLLRVPRENNMYNVDLKNIVPSRDLTCLFAKNRVLVTKPQNKTPYELLLGRTPSIGSGSIWLFDIDTLTKTTNYQPVTVGNQSNPSAGVQENFDAEKAGEDNVQQYVRFPVWSFGSNNPQNTDGDATFEHDDKSKGEAKGKSPVESSIGYRNLSAEFEDFSNNNINEVNAVNFPVLAIGQISTNNNNTFSVAGPSNAVVSQTYGKSSYMDTYQYLDDPNMPELEDITYSPDEEDVATQTRSMTRVAKDQGGLYQINIDDIHTCLFTSFLSQEEPKRVHQALKEPSWIEAMQEVLLQFKIQKEEGVDYEEVFAPVARIESIRLFLAYAFFMGFMVYQMDVKTGFLYGTIKEEVYVYQTPRFEDPGYPDKVYKVVKALYGLHQAPRAWYVTLANYLLENGFQRGKIDQTLFIKRQKNGKSAITPVDTENPLLKDPDGEDVNVHTYRSMIGSLILISWQCKKQIVVATSSTKAEYVAVVSCCAQVLWIQNQLLDYRTSVSMKKVNDVMRLLALVDKKKVIITEATIRYALRLDDAESIDCLPNEEIFTELSRMGNEFSSSMASAVISLSTGRKFNFSMYIFDSLVRNVDSSTKFYMYPRFLQLMIKVQVGDLSSHSTKYSSPTLTQKVFANMRRLGKGFYGVDTPLFEGMIVAQQVNEGVVEVNVDDVSANGVADEGAASVAIDDVPIVVDEPSIPLPTPPTQPPLPSEDLPSISQVKPTPPPSIIAQPPSPQQQPQPSHDAGMLMDLLHPLLETCTTLTRRVEHLEQDKIAQTLEITKLKQRVKKLERRNKQ